MIDKVACGSNFVLCIGKSNGVTKEDEQRMALEDKIDQLVLQ